MTQSEHGTTATRTPRVLVVDDEPLLLTTIEVALSEENSVVVRSSAVGARKLLESDSAFDVILCDLMLPGFSGIDLYEWLKQTRPHLADRMIFMTGGAYTSTARAFLEAVPNPRVEKPFDIDGLLKLVATTAGR